jgi:hypothetical protein
MSADADKDQIQVRQYLHLSTQNLGGDSEYNA